MCNENEHKLVYLETKKFDKYYNYNHGFKRIDIFYCEKCGELITKEKESCQREKPDWY